MAAWLRGASEGYLDYRPISSSDRRGEVAPPHPAIWIRGWFAVSHSALLPITDCLSFVLCGWCKRLI